MLRRRLVSLVVDKREPRCPRYIINTITRVFGYCRTNKVYVGVALTAGEK